MIRENVTVGSEPPSNTLKGPNRCRWLYMFMIIPKENHSFSRGQGFFSAVIVLFLIQQTVKLSQDILTHLPPLCPAEDWVCVFRCELQKNVHSAKRLCDNKAARDNVFIPCWLKTISIPADLRHCRGERPLLTWRAPIKLPILPINSYKQMLSTVSSTFHN